jgi:hypothetical protein
MAIGPATAAMAAMVSNKRFIPTSPSSVGGPTTA